MSKNSDEILKNMGFMDENGNIYSDQYDYDENPKEKSKLENLANHMDEIDNRLTKVAKSVFYLTLSVCTFGIFNLIYKKLYLPKKIAKLEKLIKQENTTENNSSVKKVSSQEIEKVKSEQNKEKLDNNKETNENKEKDVKDSKESAETKSEQESENEKTM